MNKHIRRIAAGGLTCILIVVAMSQLVGEAEAEPTTAIMHPSLVPEVAVRGYPVIQRDDALEGRGYTNVYVIEQVGSHIVSGGDFRRVKLQNEDIIESRSFAAWDIDTKQIECPGAFDFDGSIHAIETGPRPDTVYVGGRFNTVRGQDGVAHVRRKMVLIDLTTCEVALDFNVRGINNRVGGIEFEHGRLFIAGAFTNVDSHDTVFVAELDPDTGRANPSFTVTGQFGNKAAARALEMNDAGTRLVLAATDIETLTIGDKSIHQSATYVFEVSNPEDPRLTNHEWPEYEQGKLLHGAGINDNADRVALAYHKEVHFAELEDGPTEAKWTHNNGDGTFDAAVSNNAVYASGHFCRTEAGPGETADMSAHYGHTKCSQGGSTYRTQIAAYSLDDGTPLTWNPGNDAQTGGRAITITQRGMLFGFDGWRIGDRVVGQAGFLDFGPEVIPEIDLACIAVQVGDQVTLRWQRLDGIDTYQVRDENGWLATTTQVSHTQSNADVAQGLVVRTRSDGVVTDWPCQVVDVDGRSCLATQLGPDVRLDWTGFHPDSRVSVRQSGRWIATIQQDTSYLVSDADVDEEFELRYRLDGATQSLACAR
jgi:hypothetical protein